MTRPQNNLHQQNVNTRVKSTSAKERTHGYSTHTRMNQKMRDQEENGDGDDGGEMTAQTREIICRITTTPTVASYALLSKFGRNHRWSEIIADSTISETSFFRKGEKKLTAGAQCPSTMFDQLIPRAWDGRVPRVQRTAENKTQGLNNSFGTNQ